MKPPEYLGPYRIGDVLGRGGMGTVYRAQHARSGEDVAVKLIATQVSDEMRFRRRFHSEIETLKRLKHPNIVRLIGYGEEQGMLFYSMEFVSGESLQSIIRREKRLTWMTSLDIAIQVCAALKHAHDIGVIHRDLKPANLIIDADGVVKLVDFGISKIFGNEQTAAGSIMGTADYMAPEQAANSGITARSDLFSLGCVMYAMLCGRPPFRGKSVTEVIDAVKYREAPSLDMIDPDLPDDIVQIVGELLEKRPEDRPPTALAVMNRLKAMRAGLQRMQTLSGNNDSGPETTADGKTGAAAEASAENKTEYGTGESDDTRPLGSAAREMPTDASIVDLRAGTVRTEGRSVKNKTVSGTGAEPAAGDASADTSPGDSGQTHFQTVSDGDDREGYFQSKAATADRPTSHHTSIGLLAALLIAAVALTVVLLRGPRPDEVLATIEQFDDAGQTFEAQQEVERFLRLFPDHPRAEALQARTMRSRVESAVRRLRLKAKLRTSDSPLYETAFLEAMDLRQQDPQAAIEQLRRWPDVFQDSSMAADDERVELAELARFEARRLEQNPAASPGNTEPPGNAKSRELNERIDQAASLPDDERRKVLRGIIDLYEDRPWAEPALRRARAELD